MTKTKVKARKKEKASKAHEMLRRPVTVDVTIVDDRGQGEFRLSSPAGPGKLPIHHDYMLTFDNYQGGQYAEGFVVRFHLTDDDITSSYRFPEDLHDALWVKIVDHKGPCPSHRGNPGGVFDPIGREDEGRTLVVENPNDSVQLFGFALRFKPVSGSGRTLTYDPIGNNQNGEQR